MKKEDIIKDIYSLLDDLPHASKRLNISIFKRVSQLVHICTIEKCTQNESLERALTTIKELEQENERLSAKVVTYKGAFREGLEKPVSRVKKFFKFKLDI